VETKRGKPGVKPGSTGQAGVNLQRPTMPFLFLSSLMRPNAQAQRCLAAPKATPRGPTPHHCTARSKCTCTHSPPPPPLAWPQFPSRCADITPVHIAARSRPHPAALPALPGSSGPEHRWLGPERLFGRYLNTFTASVSWFSRHTLIPPRSTTRRLAHACARSLVVVASGATEPSRDAVGSLKRWKGMRGAGSAGGAGDVYGH